MKIPFVDLKAQYESLRGEIDAAIASVIEQTAFVGNAGNRFVKAFESEFAKFTGARHCIGCANGTDALEILLKAADIGPGDEVLVPALTWISTAEAASNIGARPVFVDVERSTCTLDPDKLEAARTKRTKAIIPVHLYGMPADLDPILEYARIHNLFVLEDCAQAHGARYRGRTVGTLGDAGSFSFFPGKNLGAYGDAGGMITDDDELAERARRIGQHGQSKVKFQHEIEGRNSRLDGLQAAVLSVKLPHLREWSANRVRIARRYDELLAGLPLGRPEVPPERDAVYHLYAIFIPDRDRVHAELAERGVACGRQYPIALPYLEAYADRGHGPDDFPVAHELAQSVLTLPIYAELDEAQQDYIIKNLKDCL